MVSRSSRTRIAHKIVRIVRNTYKSVLDKNKIISNKLLNEHDCSDRSEV